MATNKKENKPELSVGTLKNVAFYYTTVNTLTLTKDAKDEKQFIDPENPHLNTEYVVKAIVPRSTVQKLKKKFPKCSNVPHAVEYTQEDFAEAFYDGDVSLIPDVGQKEDEELVLMKFSQKACVNGGKPTQKPKCIGIKGKIQDHNGETIDDTIMIGNGSRGHIQFRPVSFGDHGIYLYPNAICITELVVYEGNNGLNFDDFDLEELDDVSTDEDLNDSDDFGDDDFE